MQEQSVPEGLHPVEGTHTGAVLEGLQPMRRTYVGEVNEGLYPMGRTPYWSRGRAIRLAFWAASAHCWLMSSFSSTNTLKSFSAGLLSIHSSPSLYPCLGLPRPRLALLNFRRFPWAHLSSLSRVSTRPLSLVSSTNLLRVHSIPLSMSPTKIPLRDTTCHWSPPGHRAVDRNSLSVTIQPIPYPLSGPLVESMSLNFRDKDVVMDLPQFESVLPVM
ncbi:hypothetical protein QYF61_016345, partial [Mycteria americana]